MMPIKTLNKETLGHACGLCGNETSHALSSLTLGFARGDVPDPDAIYVPPCSGCGAQEILQRTWDRCPVQFQNTPFYKQRKAVNTLAQRLKEMGRCESACASLHSQETEDPPDVEGRVVLNAGITPDLPDRSVGQRLLNNEHQHPALRGDNGS